MNIRASMLRKVTTGLLLASILLAAFAFSPRSVAAQGGLTYNSGFQIQNLSGTTANVSIAFYSQSSGATLGSTADTIPANANKTYFPISLPGGATSFNGSVVISSDQPVAAISNLLGSGNGSYGGSFGGFSTGGTSFKLPLVMCNNSGFNTFFSVQNAGSSVANIDIQYVPGSHGAAGNESTSINPGASKTFDQATGSSTVNCSTLAGGSGRFIGSAIITSTNGQPVVATVVQLNTTSFQTMLIYNGSSGGSTSVAAPLIMANNSGFYTSINVQNAGNVATNVTIAYGPNTGGAGAPQNETFNLAPGASKSIIQNGAPPANGSTVNNWGTIGRYIGAATITNSAAQPLVAVINEVGTPSGQGPFGSAYEGFNPSSATSSASAPLIMANNSNFFTSIQIQNVGGGACNGITVDYSPNTVGAGNPADETGINLAPGASKTIIQNSAPPGNGSVNNWNNVGRYVGSATVSGAGCQLAVIINELRPGAGDNLLTYNAFNY